MLLLYIYVSCIFFIKHNTIIFIFFSFRLLKMDVLVFSYMLRKHINHLSFFEIIKFQCFLTNSLSINPINFIEIYNFYIENIKKTIFVKQNFFLKLLSLMKRRGYYILHGIRSFWNLNTCWFNFSRFLYCQGNWRGTRNIAYFFRRELFIIKLL